MQSTSHSAVGSRLSNTITIQASHSAPLHIDPMIPGTSGDVSGEVAMEDFHLPIHDVYMVLGTGNYASLLPQI